jgi:hypothetical protein
LPSASSMVARVSSSRPASRSAALSSKRPSRTRPSEWSGPGRRGRGCPKGRST